MRRRRHFRYNLADSVESLNGISVGVHLLLRNCTIRICGIATMNKSASKVHEFPNKMIVFTTSRKNTIKSETRQKQIFARRAKLWREHQPDILRGHGAFDDI